MNKLILSLAAATALAITVPALAQQKAPEAAAKKVEIPKNVFYRGVGPSQYLAKSRLIGQNVFTKDGQSIGDIEDLILGSDNTIDGVVIGAGGFLNVGDKKIGVRYGALKLETKDGKPHITLPAATKEIIAALEPYEGSRTLLQKASDAAKSAAKKASEAAKAGYEKAKDAVQGAGKDAAAPAEQKK